MTPSTMICLTLVAGLLVACRSPTAPAPEEMPAVCSVRIPTGWVCVTPCTPLTKPWAAEVGLYFTPTDECASVAAAGPSSPSRR